jgi:predicted aldo/keto reductase-like oxidoreductase
MSLKRHPGYPDMLEACWRLLLRCTRGVAKEEGDWILHNTFEAYELILGPDGAMEGAREGVDAGKIQHIGLSSHSLHVALKAVASGHFETIQFALNFVSDEAASELVPVAREHNVGGNLRDADLAIKYLLQFENVVRDPGIEKVEQAVDTGRNCAKCGECEEKCPYQLPMREMIVENIAFFESVRV